MFPLRLGRFFFLGSLTYLASRYACIHAVSLFTHCRLRISIAFCEVASGESPTKKDCRQHGMRRADKWDSSLFCWPGNVGVSQRSVRQFRTDVITRQREYRRRFILSMFSISPIGNSASTNEIKLLMFVSHKHMFSDKSLYNFCR